MNTSAATQDAVLTALNWRYAVKKFDPSRKISDADWKVLAASLILTPSSYGLQPWRFLVIQSPEVRTQLRPISWNQAQVVEASHFVVFATQDKIQETDVKAYVDRICEIRGVTLDSQKGLHDALIKNVVQGMDEQSTLSWTQRQVYIAMGFLLQTAALLKIDSTPMEGIDPVAYDKILKLEGTGWKTAAAVALGYRHAEDPLQNLKKVRFAENQIIRYV